MSLPRSLNLVHKNCTNGSLKNFSLCMTLFSTKMRTKKAEMYSWCGPNLSLKSALIYLQVTTVLDSTKEKTASCDFQHFWKPSGRLSALQQALARSSIVWSKIFACILYDDTKSWIYLRKRRSSGFQSASFLVLRLDCSLGASKASVSSRLPIFSQLDLAMQLSPRN